MIALVFGDHCPVAADPGRLTYNSLPSEFVVVTAEIQNHRKHQNKLLSNCAFRLQMSSVSMFAQAYPQDGYTLTISFVGRAGMPDMVGLPRIVRTSRAVGTRYDLCTSSEFDRIEAQELLKWLRSQRGIVGCARSALFLLVPERRFQALASLVLTGTHQHCHGRNQSVAPTFLPEPGKCTQSDTQTVLVIVRKCNLQILE